MEFSWSSEEQAFREEVRAFIRESLPENWGTRVPGEEPYSELTLDFCRKLVAKGWYAPHWPKAYGGGGDQTPWRFVILSEELWAMGEPRGSQYMNVNWIGPAVITAGSPEQKARLLPQIASGDMLWCQGFSEAEAGSDLGAMRTSAVRDGDAYVINGEKLWTSYAKKADYCFLLARTGAEGSSGGISIFLVPMSSPGITVEVEPTMLDIHVVHRMRFKNVRAPVSDRLGEENAGWAVIREVLSNERVGTPRHIRAEALLDSVVVEASRCGALTQNMLVEAAQARAACRAARLLTYKVRQMGANGGDPGPEAYVARAAIVNAERAVAEMAANLSGMAGLQRGTAADGEFRTALIAGLGGGSYEMQLNLIARLWLNLPKAA